MAVTEPASVPEFPPATRADWLALVDKALKGRAPESLVTRTLDGLAIEPLRERAAEARPLQGRAGTPWTIVQRVDHPDPAEANRLALQDLANGANGLALVFAGAPSARGYGLAAGDLDSIARALDGVQPDLIELSLDAGAGGRAAAALLTAFLERRGLDPMRLRFFAGLDPLGSLAGIGRSRVSADEAVRHAAETASALRRRGVLNPSLVADGRPYHAAGAGEVHELGFVLATALADLRALDDAGLSADEAASCLAFRLVADAEIMLNVAKFRAVRLLWDAVLREIGEPSRPTRVEAETAWRMLTRRDPWVNLLRGTAAAFAAGAGGADAVTVLPFTLALGLPDELARRLARNTQLILVEESNVHRVGDPAAGSGSVEDLTEQLAAGAWDIFRDIERRGGMARALESGWAQAAVAEVRDARARQIAARRDPITGTSEFPQLDEAPVTVLDAPKPARRMVPRNAPFEALVAAARDGSLSGDDLPGDGRGAEPRIEPLRPMRLAEPYERLRDASDAHLARTGERPRIFLADLGPVAAFTARATFAKALFEAGGIEAPLNDGFLTPDAAAEAFRASGARIACLCSSDAVYEEMAVDAARALKRAGAERLYLAGAPGGHEARYRDAGIDGFVFAGCDALDILGEAHRVLGLTRA